VRCIRYGTPYSSPSPTSVLSFRSSPFDSFPGSRGPDFNRINAAQGSSMTSTEKSELLWGSRIYKDPVAFVIEEEGLVGLLKAQPHSGKNAVAETIDAFLALRGLDQLVIHADEAGYVAVFSHQKTTLHVRYFSGDDSAVIHRYGVCSLKSAQYRKRELMNGAPKPNEEGWRDGSTTEDIGVVVYDHVPMLSPDGVKASVRIQRKKPLTCSPGKFVDVSSPASFAAYLRTELQYSFASSFPSLTEKEKIQRGESVEFTIRFKGYRSVGEQNLARDQELRSAYEDGLRHAIHSLLGNIYAIPARQKQYSALREVPLAQQA